MSVDDKIFDCISCSVSVSGFSVNDFTRLISFFISFAAAFVMFSASVLLSTALFCYL